MSVWNGHMSDGNLCPFQIDICQFRMDICQMGIYVHSKWTYVRLEFMSIRNGHVCQIGIVKIIR